jgi:hypothetical protein
VVSAGARGAGDGDNNEQEQQDAIRALREHHKDGTGAAWSLDPAKPVAIHGACVEYEFVNPNGLAGFILDADGIPRPVTDAVSLARALTVARGWDYVQTERRRVAEKPRRRRKVKQ